MPDDETVRHLESRAKIYAEEKKKQQVDSLEKAVVDAKSKLEAAKAKAAKAKPKDANPKGKDGKDEELSTEEQAVVEAERTVSAAEKAKARVEEAPPDVQPVPLLEKVFDGCRRCVFRLLADLVMSQSALQISLMYSNV